MAKIEVKAGGVPEGICTGKFTGVEDGTHEEYGQRKSWKFTADAGKYDGTDTGRFTGAIARPGTACFAMLCAIAGRTLEIGEEFDPDTMIGRRYQLVIEKTLSGTSTRVAKAILIQDEPAVANSETPY